jgi:hypothetical protein
MGKEYGDENIIIRIVFQSVAPGPEMKIKNRQFNASRLSV